MIQGATRKILAGTPIEITEGVPDFLAERGVSAWYMAQPSPELYDDGQMVYQAKRLLSLNNPDVAALSKLPPSPEWKAQQKATIAQLDEQIAELTAIRDGAAEAWTGDEDPPVTIGLTPEQAYQLQTLVSWRDGAEETLKTATQADEIVTTRAAKARAEYMMPHLIVDKAGNVVFDVETDAGRAEWNRLSLYKRSVLRGYFNEALSLVILAKN